MVPLRASSGVAFLLFRRLFLLVLIEAGESRVGEEAGALPGIVV